MRRLCSSLLNTMVKKPLRFVLIGILAASVVRAASQAPAVLPPKPATKTAVPMKVAIPNTKTAAAPLAPAKTPSPYQLYTYYADRYRDPFIPLTGGMYMDQGTDRPPQISALLLKGIIQDTKGRMALLTSGASSYILRGGRLYDGRNHLMKGISGVIKSNTVVLMGSDRTVKELKVVDTTL